MKQMLVIARREITSRLRSKGLVVGVLVICVIALAAGGAVRLASSYGYLETDSKLALTPQTEPYRQVFAFAKRTNPAVGIRVTRASSSAQARKQVRDGTVDLALIRDNNRLVLLTHSKVGYATHTVINAVTSLEAISDYISELGGNQQELTKRISANQVRVERVYVTGEHEHGNDIDLANVLGAAAIMLVLFMAVIIGSQLVASGVIEEKSSRIIEVLLATVRPTRLLVAKVVSIALLVVIGEALVLACIACGVYISGYGAHLRLNVIEVSVWAVLFAIVGFLSYGFVYGGLASLASRQEDMAAATMPITLIAVLAVYIPYFAVLWNPASQLPMVVSFIPLFACFSAPLLIALGLMPLPHIVVSFAISVVFMVLAAAVSARIYRNSVLHFGRRRSLFASLRRGQ